MDKLRKNDYEPVYCNKIVFNDEGIKAEHLWHWNVKSLYEDRETGILRAILKGEDKRYTYASIDGRRLTAIDFDYIDNFNEGLSVVDKCNCGYGYINKNMEIVIPLQFEYAEEFRNGYASVKLNGEWFHIDKNGNRLSENKNSYQEVGNFSEGLCKVSTLKLDITDLAYHSDNLDIVGTWGFIDESGAEVIPPQYIYAEDFYSDRAIVCKGEWTINGKWNNECNDGMYWTEYELWGVIDKNGREIVPCIFDEIKTVGEIENRIIIMVHSGGWENGKWGVMTLEGEWVVGPQFEDIGYEYFDGMFTFYSQNKWNDDHLIGIYDLTQNKVIFEPQFKDVSFMTDGWIEVKVFDEKLGRNITKIIDKQGNEKFSSIYSEIYTWGKPYEVLICDKRETKHGLIDENGNVILPCVHTGLPFNGISYEKKYIIFNENNKQGIKDFDGNIIVSPMYYEIYGVNNSLITVRVGEKDNYKEGLISHTGKEVIPAKYDSISWYKEDFILARSESIGCDVYRITSIKKE